MSERLKTLAGPVPPKAEPPTAKTHRDNIHSRLGILQAHLLPLMANAMITNMTWDEGLSELHALMPCCSGISDRNKLSPGAIYTCAKKIGIDIPFTKIQEYESLDDDDLARFVVPEKCLDARRFVVMSDISYCGKGPFLSTGVPLGSFIEYHSAQYHQMLFDDDVIILFPDEKVIAMYRHEGWYAAADCSGGV